MLRYFPRSTLLTAAVMVLFAVSVGVPTSEAEPVNQEDQSETPFLMRVELTMGSGIGLLPDRSFGPISRMDLVGPLLQGALPSAGVTVVVARVGQDVLSAPVRATGQWPDGRVRVQLDDVLPADLDGAYALSTDPAALDNVPPPARRAGEPGAEDEYADYSGPALPYGWGDVDGVDVELVIELERPPTPDAAAALQRAVRAWDKFGVLQGFGPALFRGGPGFLHGLYVDEQFGPRWQAATLRWLEDFGSANPSGAADDLARRLAGWSQRWGVGITRLQFGR